ncbi:MAB_1171c family putative transporter [Amycolatopsis vancoresmycina]|uniref:DUF6545 domain-containing protein n=1 Tax=Amycolatopsis vancoresmycina DSM 44592 TaxID=1292037 RepID=R1HSE4_9PSEU|nr:MAB_1171c family putative transporter [Amycolatopsis vancoresmycina]EOD66470.1 hypothetical protein H480_21292 [Amycolatopsis vancoresmycina DSM 44592]
MSVSIVVVGICWAGLLAKLWDLRRNPRNHATRWLCVMLITISLACSGQLRPVSDRVDGLTTPGTTWVLANCLTLVAGLAAQASFLHTANPGEAAVRKVRARLWLTVAVIVVIAILFLTVKSNYAEFHAKEGTAQQVPATGAHSYLYVAYLAVLAAAGTQAALAYAAIADRFCLRAGLRITATGMAVTVLYGVTKVVGMAGYQLGLLPAGKYTESVIGSLFTVAILLFMLGSTLPAWGPRAGLDTLADWSALNVTYYRLFPLWDALSKAFPDIALDAPRSWFGRRIPLRNASLAVYRRVIEILDARLRLRPFLDEQVADSARGRIEEAGIPAARADAIVEATVLKEALAAHRQGIAAGTPAHTPESYFHDGTAAQTAWLTAVAKEFPATVLRPRATTDLRAGEVRR